MKLRVLEVRHQQEKRKLKQRRDEAIEKVRIKTQVLKSAILGSILLAHVCALVICKVSKTKHINNTTVRSGQLDRCVNWALTGTSYTPPIRYLSVPLLRKQKRWLFLFIGPCCKQSDLPSCLCAVETSIKAVPSRGGGSVRVWIEHLACVTSTVRLCSAATEALNKSQREPLRSFFLLPQF